MDPVFSLCSLRTCAKSQSTRVQIVAISNGSTSRSTLGRIPNFVGEDRVEARVLGVSASLAWECRGSKGKYRAEPRRRGKLIAADAQAGGEIWYNLNLIIAEGKMKMKYVVYVAIATLLAGCVFADTAVALMRRVEEFCVVVLACALFA